MSTQPVAPGSLGHSSEVILPHPNPVAQTYEQRAAENELRQIRKNEFDRWKQEREQEILDIRFDMDRLNNDVFTLHGPQEQVADQFARLLWDAAERIQQANLADQLNDFNHDYARIKPTKALLRDTIARGQDFSKQFAKDFSENRDKHRPNLLAFREVGGQLFCHHRRRTAEIRRERFPELNDDGKVIPVRLAPPPVPPPAPRQLAPHERVRLADQLEHCLNFVESPIPWRPGDRPSSSEWCAKYPFLDRQPAAMGPLWAEEISRLAVMMHATLGTWPAPRYCPDEHSLMVWDLFELSVQIGAEQELNQLAILQDEAPPHNSTHVHLLQVYNIMSTVLRLTPATFNRFKAAFRTVVESILTGSPPAASSCNDSNLVKIVEPFTDPAGDVPTETSSPKPTPATQAPPTLRKDIHSLFPKLRPHQFDELVFLLDVPIHLRPSDALNFEVKKNQLLKWAEGPPSTLEILLN